ncbi:hypothetical protein [Bradyrhizobium sp. HKCCYLS20291]|uniref:hypothetical protein n=1 Tax=Bradyrhizobium sp. HKCCYLS20291 TaxID=3420766 RepID=UPI003EBE79B0
MTLSRELLQIRRNNRLIFTGIDAINTRLKMLAREKGKFRATSVAPREDGIPVWLNFGPFITPQTRWRRELH